MFPLTGEIACTIHMEAADCRVLHVGILAAYHESFSHSRCDASSRNRQRRLPSSILSSFRFQAFSSEEASVDIRTYRQVSTSEV